jgi:hypothetical protein
MRLRRYIKKKKKKEEIDDSNALLDSIVDEINDANDKQIRIEAIILTDNKEIIDLYDLYKGLHNYFEFEKDFKKGKITPILFGLPVEWDIN